MWRQTREKRLRLRSFRMTRVDLLTRRCADRTSPKRQPRTGLRTLSSGSAALCADLAWPRVSSCLLVTVAGCYAYTLAALKSSVFSAKKPNPLSCNPHARIEPLHLGLC
jgi:hypothetical protein